MHLNWILYFKSMLVHDYCREEAWDKNMESQTTRSELKAFCEDTTIYGLRYFVNSRRPWERLFWISFLILGIFLCILIVRKSLVDWEVSITVYYINGFHLEVLVICFVRYFYIFFTLTF